MTIIQAHDLVDNQQYQKIELSGHEFLGLNGSIYEARITDTGELATTVTERERNLYVHILQSNISSSLRLLAVDLSDTVNWLHNNTGRIDLSTLETQVNVSSAADGILKCGVITRIDDTNADIAWFKDYIFSKSTAGDIIREFNFAPSQIKLGVDEDGNLTKLVTNNKTLNDATLNTGMTLGSSLGTNVTPGKGDFIIELNIVSGSASFVINCMYHTESSV